MILNSLSQINHIDIAPAHAGILMGITNSVASTCGFSAPYVISLIVTIPVSDLEYSLQLFSITFHVLFLRFFFKFCFQQGSIVQWRIVFILSALIYTVTNLFYVFFATGEEQEWNRSEKRNEDPGIISEHTNTSL